MDPADLDRIDVAGLRRAGGLKWSTYPEAIGAFVAEMDFGTAPPVTAALHAAVDAGALGYLPAATSAAMSAAYASWSADRYGWAVDPADVRPIADVVAGVTLAIEHFSAPGTAVLLPTPACMPFVTVPVGLGREVVQVPLVPVDGRPRYDLEALDAAFAAGAGRSSSATRTTRSAGSWSRPNCWRSPRWWTGTAPGCSPTRSTRRWSTPGTGTCRTRRCRR